MSLSRYLSENSVEPTPARLESLTIFRPALGATEETQRDQILFHYFDSNRQSPNEKGNGAKQSSETEVENQVLRQVGLARGMNAFAGNFSRRGCVDSIDSDKYRSVQLELETGWWVLVRIRAACHSRGVDRTKGEQQATSEYSAREISPKNILINHLQRANRIFLLHHGRSLTELFDRMQQVKFNALLSSFWLPFARTWDIHLHGNPSADVFSGIRLSSSGELGIGVGEEAWGSGERAAMEGIISDTPGLVDSIVMRFNRCKDMVENSTERSHTSSKTPRGPTSWLGTGQEPQTSDGVIFSGIGTLCRTSVRDLADWARLLFTDGSSAYGVRDSLRSVHRRRTRPHSTRTQEPSRREERLSQDRLGTSHTAAVPIPPPIVASAGSGPSSLASPSQINAATSTADPDPSEGSQESRGWRKYLTLGYGTSWMALQGEKHMDKAEATGELGQSNHFAEEANPERTDFTDGAFLIGLEGSLASMQTVDHSRSGQSGNRIVARSMYLWINSAANSQEEELSTTRSEQNAENGAENQNSGDYRRMRIVVYAREPMLFMFVFEPQCGQLEMSSFYHNLHQTLHPLYNALLVSTSEERSLQRQSTLGAPHSEPAAAGGTEASSSSMFSLTYDAQSLNIRCTIPNISPPAYYQNKSGSGWSRLEALNVQTQVVQMVAETTGWGDDRERIIKTNRGWWVTWIRVPPRLEERANQAVLVRRAATEHSGNERPKQYGGFASLGRLVSTGGYTPNERYDTERLGDEAVALDTRKYVRALFSLNR